ncbi:hypothetical protein V1478_008023 [Vespula squamosa]|uniref:Uncharacterized protein n=1 Tax=Vespula squamosa TaxID=30214 RepID=A0ABD2AZF9_VESSQ
MIIIYRVSARNLPNFHYPQRNPQNLRFGNTLIGNLNQSSNPNSYPTSKLEEPEDTNETQETFANLEEAENEVDQ